jgi:hypothetical protein
MVHHHFATKTNWPDMDKVRHKPSTGHHQVRPHRGLSFVDDHGNFM